ncbi:MAG: NAD(P)/FAD-dependent oxidoreductase [Clostridium sp.]|nr:NAD(P)/FAD-dependent oxidoreductase [Clostridium sp.]
MEKYDLVVIGSGASGLVSAITAMREGVRNVLIIEKEEDLGGNLNLFIHDGFGSFYLGEKVTGPEFSSIMINDYKELGGKFLTNTKVIEISDDKKITVINPEKGVYDIEADAIILATGCKEKFTGNIMIPIDRYTGIFTIASAHRLVNFIGYLPGKEVVIQESGKWSVLLARRLLIEGAKVKALVTIKESLDKEEADILDGFDIPVIYNARVSEIGGAQRVEWAAVMIDEKEEELIECNSLILSVGYYPQIDLIRGLNVDIKTINSVEDGFFACGTVKHGIDRVFSSGEDGYIIGHLASQYIKKHLY